MTPTKQCNVIYVILHFLMISSVLFSFNKALIKKQPIADYTLHKYIKINKSAEI